MSFQVSTLDAPLPCLLCELPASSHFDGSSKSFVDLRRSGRRLRTLVYQLSRLTESGSARCRGAVVRRSPRDLHLCLRFWAAAAESRAMHDLSDLRASRTPPNPPCARAAEALRWGSTSGLQNGGMSIPSPIFEHDLRQVVRLRPRFGLGCREVAPPA